MSGHPRSDKFDPKPSQRTENDLPETTIKCNAMDCLFWAKELCQKPNVLIELSRSYTADSGFTLHFQCKDYYSP